jgi:hypothetical protein
MKVCLDYAVQHFQELVHLEEYKNVDPNIMLLVQRAVAPHVACGLYYHYYYYHSCFRHVACGHSPSTLCPNLPLALLLSHHYLCVCIRLFLSDSLPHTHARTHMYTGKTVWGISKKDMGSPGKFCSPGRSSHA